MTDEDAAPVPVAAPVVAVAPPSVPPLPPIELIRLQPPSPRNVFAWRSVKIVGHGDSMTSAGFTQDLARVVTGSVDGTVRLWDGESGAAASRFDGHAQVVSAVAASPDGHRLASLGKDGTLRIWDVEAGKETRRIPIGDGYHQSLRVLAFSGDGVWLAGGGDDRGVRIWNVETGALTAKLEGHTRAITAMVFASPPSLVTADAGGHVFVWDALKGARTNEFEAGKIAVRNLAASASGSRIGVVFADRTLGVFEVSGTRVLSNIGIAPLLPGPIAFSADGNFVAVGGGTVLAEPDPAREDYGIREFGVTSGKLVATFKGHDASILALGARRSDAGTQVWVSVSADETIKEWRDETQLSAAPSLPVQTAKKDQPVGITNN